MLICIIDKINMIMERKVTINDSLISTELMELFHGIIFLYTFSRLLDRSVKVSVEIYLDISMVSFTKIKKKIQSYSFLYTQIENFCYNLYIKHYTLSIYI